MGTAVVTASEDMGSKCMLHSSEECSPTLFQNSTFPNISSFWENNTDFFDFHREDTVGTLIQIIITAVYSVVFVVGLVGNCLVMYMIIRHTKMKTATNIYIFNLAAADALTTSTMPFQSAYYLMGSWPFGDVLCKIVASIDYYNMFTSIFTLTMMSIDRYIAVCHPVKALDFRTPLNAKIVNVCIWLIASVIGVPVIVLGTTKISNDGIECALQFPNHYNYWDAVLKICVFIFGFVIPIFIISVCYSLMIMRLKSVRLLSGSRDKDRNLRRITRMVLIIVAVFIICWTPIHIFLLVDSVVNVPNTSAVSAGYYFSVALGYTNSSLNPILYAFLDENFKRCFKDFCCSSGLKLELQTSGRVRIATQNAAKFCDDIGNSNQEV
ncbi:kappa-type opioid receptor [Amblyraja radiata]|uniref:kappa-type opioid receptor n=1 Tax=Amblyraja radiata TaxID=386614 RepID=UPI0014034E33|nr:kappa-type opioid receptor [Amblyraja radiata]